MFGLGKEKDENQDEKIIKLPEGVSMPPALEPPKEEKEEKAVEPPPLTWREAKALKKSKYEQISSKFNKAFVLRNTKTGQVVELRAASAFHACNIIGWKKNKVKVLDVVDVPAPVDIVESKNENVENGEEQK